MFPRFQSRYPRDGQGHAISGNAAPEFLELSLFLNQFGGASFGRGLYRIIASSNIKVWNDRVLLPFSDFGGRISCFAYDWLGRVFALDRGRLEDDRPGVVMFEPGTGEALEIPCNLETFHTNELLEFGDAALAVNFHQEWLDAGGAVPTIDQCVGYKRPLFLGGSDDVDNLELSDIDVYWHLFGQLIEQTRGQPIGTRVHIGPG